MLSAAESPALADQNHDTCGPERRRHGIADSDPSVANDDQRGDLPVFVAQRGIVATGPVARAVHGARRQTISDDEHDIVVACMRRQRGFGFVRKPAAEIWTHQICLAVPRALETRKNRVAEAGQGQRPDGPHRAVQARHRGRGMRNLRSSSGAVASDAPLRGSPMRAAV